MILDDVFNKSIDQLSGWLVQVGWLVGLVDHWLVGWLVGWLVE